MLIPLINISLLPCNKIHRSCSCLPDQTLGVPGSLDCHSGRALHTLGLLYEENAHLPTQGSNHDAAGYSVEVFGRYVGIPLARGTSERGRISDNPCLSVVERVKAWLFGEGQQHLYDYEASTDGGLWESISTKVPSIIVVPLPLLLGSVSYCDSLLNRQILCEFFDRRSHTARRLKIGQDTVLSMSSFLRLMRTCGRKMAETPRLLLSVWLMGALVMMN